MNEGLQLLEPMSDSQICDIICYLARKPVVNAHVPDAADSTGSFYSVDWPMGCWPTHCAVNAPHWLEYVIGTYQLAKDYFNEPPLLYSVNAFFTQPSTGFRQVTHDWHRDHDDRKQLSVFMFCSTTDGHFKYVANSANKNDAVEDYSGYDPPEELIRTVYANHGTVFAADTNGLHMGLRPTYGRRVLLWARWGVSDPPAIYKHAPVEFDLIRLSKFPEEVRKSTKLSIIGV